MIPGVSYSYATCGGSDEYDQWVIKSALKGRSIRVGIDSWSKMTFRDPHTGNWTGYILDVWKRMAARAGFEMVFVTERSELARQKHANRFTQCAYDVALGHVETCIPVQWDTLERRHFTDYLASTRVDQLKIVSKVHHASSMNIIFQPFNIGLWGALAATFICVAVAMYFFEKDMNDRDFPGKPWQLGWPDGNLAQGVTQGLYQTIMHIVSAGPVCQPASASGRIVNVAFGLFVLLCLAAYTANFTAHMVERAQIMDIQTVDDLLKQQARVCILDQIDDLVAAAYPALKARDLIVTCGTGNLSRSPLSCVHAWGDQSEQLRAIDEGDCDAAIDSEEALQTALEREEHCGKTLAPTTVLEIVESNPMLPGILSRALSYQLTQIRIDGTLRQLQNNYRKGRKCKDVGVAAQHLDFTSMSGAFAILFTGIFVAWLVKMIHQCRVTRYFQSIARPRISTAIQARELIASGRFHNTAQSTSYDVEQSGNAFHKSPPSIANALHQGVKSPMDGIISPGVPLPPIRRESRSWHEGAQSHSGSKSWGRECGMPVTW